VFGVDRRADDEECKRCKGDDGDAGENPVAELCASYCYHLAGLFSMPPPSPSPRETLGMLVGSGAWYALRDPSSHAAGQHAAGEGILGLARVPAEG
jgi:hypothetical protein